MPIYPGGYRPPKGERRAEALMELVDALERRYGKDAVRTEAQRVALYERLMTAKRGVPIWYDREGQVGPSDCAEMVAWLAAEHGLEADPRATEGAGGV